MKNSIATNACISTTECNKNQIGMPFFPSFIFLPGSQILKAKKLKNNYMPKENWNACLGKGKGLEETEKNLSLHLSTLGWFLAQRHL